MLQACNVYVSSMSKSQCRGRTKKKKGVKFQ